MRQTEIRLEVQRSGNEGTIKILLKTGEHEYDAVLLAMANNEICLKKLEALQGNYTKEALK
jgi:hypothetical protein